MNERIKELALEARLGPALLLHHWGNVDALTDIEQEELKQIEKFAELMMQECISVIQNIKPQYGDYRETAQSAYCIDQIKRHFRVEEPELSAADRILQTVRKRG